MKPLFLITARGGSKGVPGKNIRSLGGIPLIEHSIRTALQVSSSPRNVVVSTDSLQISEIAKKAGARVPFMRPDYLATDTAGSREVMLHAIDFLNGQEAVPYDCIVLLQPTSPFRNVGDIKRGLEIFESQKPDMVVSVKPAASNPYYNAFECNDQGFLKISKGEGKITRRQDAPPVWEFDGSIYIISPEALRAVSSLAGMQRIVPLVNTASPNIDIDSELDFIIAEHLCPNPHR